MVDEPISVRYLGQTMKNLATINASSARLGGMGGRVLGGRERLAGLLG